MAILRYIEGSAQILGAEVGGLGSHVCHDWIEELSARQGE